MRINTPTAQQPAPIQRPSSSPAQAFYPADPHADIAAKPWVLPSPPALTFVNANVVDPGSSRLYKNQTLKIKDGKIVSLSSTDLSSDIHQAMKEGAKVVDAKDWFLCPGLIDCHVHITACPGAATIAATINSNRDVNVLRSTWVLKGMLSRGFTTVRDVGGASKAHADATDEGLIPGPRLFQGGPVVSQTGGHADSSDPSSSPHMAGSCCGGTTNGSLGVTVDGVPSALLVTRDIMRKGADHVKICTSGGVGSVTDKLEGIQFTHDELVAITTTVKNMGGRLVTSHCYTSEGIRHAIAGGVGGIEHGNLLDEETAKLMAEKKVFLTPTLAVHTIISSPPYGGFLLPSQLEKNELVRTKGLEAIVHAEKAGVVVCYGTDMLGSMHPLQTNEFVTRSKVLPAATVLKHATSNPAKLLGMEGKIGTLKPGAFADMVIMTSNPLDDVTIFDRYNETQLAVLKEGRVMKSKTQSLVAEVSLV